MKFILTEADIRAALREEAGMSDYTLTVQERADVTVMVAGQAMVVRLMKVDRGWKWYGARMLEPPMDGSPSEAMQWLKSNRLPNR